MSKYQKDFPLWLAIAAPVLLVAAVVTFFIGGKEQQAAAVDQVMYRLDDSHHSQEIVHSLNPHIFWLSRSRLWLLLLCL